MKSAFIIFDRMTFLDFIGFYDPVERAREKATKQIENPRERAIIVRYIEEKGVEPKQAAPGNPWTWTMEFPDAFTDRTGVPQLLAKGFHHVHISVGNTHGCLVVDKDGNVTYEAHVVSGKSRSVMKFDTNGNKI